MCVEAVHAGLLSSAQTEAVIVTDLSMQHHIKISGTWLLNWPPDGQSYTVAHCALHGTIVWHAGSAELLLHVLLTFAAMRPPILCSHVELISRPFTPFTRAS
jgi:hypothetical protein